MAQKSGMKRRKEYEYSPENQGHPQGPPVRHHEPARAEIRDCGRRRLRADDVRSPPAADPLPKQQRDPRPCEVRPGM